MPTPRRRLLATFAFSALVLTPALAGCGGTNPFHQTAASSVPGSMAPSGSTANGDGLANNDYLPDQNLSSCVNTNERPGCGSTSKGGWRMYLVFAALILGVGFVMSRVVKAVRQRDIVVNAEPATRDDQPSAP